MAEVSYERVMPQAVDVETAVLGAMLIDKGAIAKVIEILHEDSFYRDAHRKIYSTLVSLFERDEEADQITVSEELRRRGQLEEVGGAYYLATLAGDVATSANVEYHAKIVLNKALLRKLITFSTQITSESYEDVGDVRELIDTAEERIFSLSEQLMNLRTGFTVIEKILHEEFDELEKAHKRTDYLPGLRSGYRELDDMTAGFQRGDLIIVAGRPSMGKTALGLCVARNVAVDRQVGVGIFSLEMSGSQLAQRLMCAEASVDSQKLRMGGLRDDEWNRLARNVGKLAEAPLYIDDTPSINVLEMKAKTRRLLSEHSVGLVIVDYLQLMSFHMRSENRQQEISYISRSLKSMAKELRIPVIAISQLSRAVELRGGDRRPQLSDLRESGAIEQDADVVMFVYHPSMYDEKDEEGNPIEEGVAEIIIRKQRNGPTGTVMLSWVDKYAAFRELETHRQETDMPDWEVESVD